MAHVNQWPIWVKIIIGIIIWIGILWTPKSLKGGLVWLGILLFVLALYFFAH